MALPGEKQLFQTYLRRLSYRSEQHPSAFHVSNVEVFSHDSTSKLCSHSRGGLQKPIEGGFGKVSRAKWSKPDKTVEVVAIKTFKVSRQFVILSFGI